MYLDFYDLQAPPFQLTSDRRFFFAAPQYLSALQDLTSDRAMEKGFRVITGELGAGKSMLCYVMRSELERSNACVAHLATTQIGPDDLLRMLAAQFGIYRASGGPGVVLAGIRDFVTHSLEAGQRVVLFIDEAQNLPKSSFRALCSLADLEVDGRPPLEIFLIGQTEFRQALASRAMIEVRRRLVSTHHLKPLGPGETRSFILHRLRMAGWRDDPSFSEESFRTIYRLTGGIPRRINVFCNRLLMDAHLKGLHEIDNGFVLQVVRDAQTEQLPIGGLTFDEDLLSRDEMMPDPDRPRDAIAERPTALPWLQHAPRSLAASCGPLADSADKGQASAAAEVEPPPPARQEFIAGPSPTYGFERPVTAETWFDRNGVRIGNGALWVAVPMLVGLILYSTAVLFGVFEDSGNQVAAVVKLPPISQIGSDQIAPPEATGTAVAPAAPATPDQVAHEPPMESPPPLDQPPALPSPAETLPLVEAPALAYLPARAAAEPPEERLVPPVPDPPAEIAEVVRAKRQDDPADRTAPLRLVPETSAVEHSVAPDRAGLDAAPPSLERPAKPDSPVRSSSLAETEQVVPLERREDAGARTAPLRLVPETLMVEQSTPSDSVSLDAALPGPGQPAGSSSPAKTRSLKDFVRNRPPAAPLRVAETPRMTLVDFVLTRAIVDREPVDDVETFAVADGRAFAFARIENPGPSAKVFFVWTRGDQVQANVGLDVKTSARWRTWSAATLKPGSWRVQVVSADQEVLGERLFVVEP